MKLADYDRDGHAVEFLIQVGTMPCGKHQFAAVGLSRGHNHLRPLATVDHPETPLVMPLNAWEALRQRSEATVVPTWECGDHGSERRTELLVSADAGAIRARNRSFSCPEDGSAEKLMEEEDR